MSDPVPTPPPAPAKPKRTVGPINKRIVNEIEAADQIVAVARETEYATALADEEIDAAVLDDLSQKNHRGEQIDQQCHQ